MSRRWQNILHEYEVLFPLPIYSTEAVTGAAYRDYSAPPEILPEKPEPAALDRHRRRNRCCGGKIQHNKSGCDRYCRIAGSTCQPQYKKKLDNRDGYNRVLSTRSSMKPTSLLRIREQHHLELIPDPDSEQLNAISAAHIAQVRQHSTHVAAENHTPPRKTCLIKPAMMSRR